MEINERISKIIEHSGLSPAEFAEETGIQRSSISHIISGRNKPSLDFITKIKAAFPEIEWEWLIRGEGEMIVIKEENIKEDKNIIEKSKKSNLPNILSLFDDENFGSIESEDRTQKQNPRESVIPSHLSGDINLSDSHTIEKKSRNIRRIVFFFEDGTFETYEN